MENAVLNTSSMIRLKRSQKKYAQKMAGYQKLFTASGFSASGQIPGIGRTLFGSNECESKRASERYQPRIHSRAGRAVHFLIKNPVEINISSKQITCETDKFPKTGM